MSNIPLVEPPSRSTRLRRFFRSPKGLLILVLSALTVGAAVANGVATIAPGVIGAVVTAMLLDAPLLRRRKRKWVMPDGALLTGLIVAMVLSAQAPWYVGAFASALGVAAKYFLRSRTANIFNPAALALLAAYVVFHSGQSWWGALPDLTPALLEPVTLAVLLATGLLVADRVSRGPAALSFLGGYYLLFTANAFLGDPAHVAAIFRSSDLHAALFFAFFMVTDPPTSPPGPRNQIIFGAIVAGVSYAVFFFVGAVYYLLVGLLVANAWEAWRRVQAKPAHSAAKDHAL